DGVVDAGISGSRRLRDDKVQLLLQIDERVEKAVGDDDVVVGQNNIVIFVAVLGGNELIEDRELGRFFEEPGDRHLRNSAGGRLAAQSCPALRDFMPLRAAQRSDDVVGGVWPIGQIDSACENSPSGSGSTGSLPKGPGGNRRPGPLYERG